MVSIAPSATLEKINPMLGMKVPRLRTMIPQVHRALAANSTNRAVMLELINRYTLQPVSPRSARIMRDLLLGNPALQGIIAKQITPLDNEVLAALHAGGWLKKSGIATA